MTIILLYMLLCVWLIDVIFTFWCTVLVGRELKRLERLYEKIQRRNESHEE